MAANGVNKNHLTAGSVTANTLAADAVTAAKITAGAIVAGKISAGAINTSALFVDGVIITDLIDANAVQAPQFANPANQNWVGRNSGVWYPIASVTIPVNADTVFVEGQYTCRLVATLQTGTSIYMESRLVIDGTALYTETGPVQSGAGSTTFSSKGFGFRLPGGGNRVVQMQARAVWNGAANFAQTQVQDIYLKATAPKR